MLGADNVPMLELTNHVNLGRGDDPGQNPEHSREERGAPERPWKVQEALRCFQEVLGTSQEVLECIGAVWEVWRGKRPRPATGCRPLYE